MARGRRHSAEQIAHLLRQIETSISGGETTSIACIEAGIAEQTYYRWRAEFGELKTDQIRHLDELQRENRKLKRLVAQLNPDQSMF
jgi:putative transposase